MSENTNLNGYTVRPGTIEDIPSAVEMLNAYSMTISGTKNYEVEEMQLEWKTPGFNPATDTLVVINEDGEVIAVQEVWAHIDPYVRMWSFGRVHPDYQHQGIGSYLFDWGEKRARETIEKAPEGTRVSLLCDTDIRDEVTQKLWAAKGMEEVRYFWRMVIELDKEPPTPQWPEGVSARPMREDERRATYKAVRDSFKDHWGHVERPFEEAYKQWLHWLNNDPLFDPDLFFIAVSGDEITGVSLCWANMPEDREMGWVGTLGVRREWRHQGIALALLHHTFREFHKRGNKRVGLGVDASSLTGATRLYEKAGMHVAREYRMVEKVLRDGVDISTQSVPESEA